MNLFSSMKEPFKFKHRPIRLFEAFSGIGTQAMALKRMGIEIEHVGISEIDKHAINSYNAIHGNVKNYGSITDIQGSDLPPIDIFTWSFPCTDLSKAGKQKGLVDTRSGLGYEVIRILKEIGGYIPHRHMHSERTTIHSMGIPNDDYSPLDKSKLPKVLLMENVPDLLSAKFRDGWHEMYNEIEKLGYTNYVETLNAKNYGVAQNRDRVFMVSILGDYAYEFPKPFKLKKRLKDYLEDEVDEKYYLSDKQIKQISNWKAQRDPLKDAKNQDDDVLQTITAKSNTSMNSSMLLIKEPLKIKTWNDETKAFKTRDDDMPRHRIYDTESVGFAITTNESQQPTLIDNMRIRKLTPLEAWRLMGIDDNDYYKAQNVCSNTQLYKQAGNAIVVDVLVEIFKKLF